MTVPSANTVVLLGNVDTAGDSLQRVIERAGIPGALPLRSRATRAMVWFWASAIEASGRLRERLEGVVREPTWDGRPDNCVSFSYSRDWIGACVSESGAIGLDLEAYDDVPGRVARRTMAAADERRLLARAPAERDRAAATHWCAAEAVAKAHGIGIPMMLGRRTVTGLRSSGISNGTWFKVFEPLPGLCCAVAGMGERGRISVFRLSEMPTFELLPGGALSL